MATRTTYYVTTKNNAWWIHLNGKEHGPYSTQAIAKRAAVDAAHRTPNSQVVMQGRDAKWITEWTYGNDPYPPKG